MHLSLSHWENRRYACILPLFGIWHFEYNVQKAIFELAGPWILSPLTHELGRTYGEIPRHGEVKNFHKTDSFLCDFAAAGCLYADQLMVQSNVSSIPALMELVKENDNLYDLLYILFYYIVPYSQLRRAVREGDMEEFERQLPIWLQLFISTHKTKYARVCLTHVRMLEELTPEWKNFVRRTMLCKMSSNGWCGGMDMFIEDIHHQIRSALPNLTLDNYQRKITETEARLNFIAPLSTALNLAISRTPDAPCSILTANAHSIADIMSIKDWFGRTFGTVYNPSMRRPSQHSVIFPPVNGTSFDTVDHAPIFMRVESAMDNFEADIRPVVEHCKRAIIRSARNQDRRPRRGVRIAAIQYAPVPAAPIGNDSSDVEEEDDNPPYDQ